MKDQSSHLTILSDLNVKVNYTHDSPLMLLLDFLDSFDLSNKVIFPSHKQSNTID